MILNGDKKIIQWRVQNLDHGKKLVTLFPVYTLQAAPKRQKSIVRHYRNLKTARYLQTIDSR
jgi:hypothetical protein